jgi:hypothetical protein
MRVRDLVLAAAVLAACGVRERPAREESAMSCSAKRPLPADAAARPAVAPDPVHFRTATFALG